jgi:2-haloacid dehalogenase
VKTRGTVSFDIIGTCFSLDLPRTRLVELGAPAHALQLWFAQTLRDAFALSHAGGYRPLKEVLEAELPRTLNSPLGLYSVDWRSGSDYLPAPPLSYGKRSII